MALCGLIVADMKCLCLSVLLVCATQRTTNCVALAISVGRFQLVNNIRARRNNACVRICSITQQSYRTQLYFRHRVVLGDTDDTTIYRDTKSHDTSIAEVTILSRY